MSNPNELTITGDDSLEDNFALFFDRNARNSKPSALPSVRDLVVKLSGNTPCFPRHTRFWRIIWDFVANVLLNNSHPSPRVTITSDVPFGFDFRGDEEEIEERDDDKEDIHDVASLTAALQSITTVNPGSHHLVFETHHHPEDLHRKNPPYPVVGLLAASLQLQISQLTVPFLWFFTSAFVNPNASFRACKAATVRICYVFEDINFMYGARYQIPYIQAWNAILSLPVQKLIIEIEAGIDLDRIASIINPIVPDVASKNRKVVIDVVNLGAVNKLHDFVVKLPPLTHPL